MNDREKQTEMESERPWADGTINRPNPPLAYSSESHRPVLPCVTLQRRAEEEPETHWQMKAGKGTKMRVLTHQQVGPLTRCCAVSLASGRGEGGRTNQTGCQQMANIGNNDAFLYISSSLPVTKSSVSPSNSCVLSFSPLFPLLNLLRIYNMLSSSFKPFWPRGCSQSLQI